MVNTLSGVKQGQVPNDKVSLEWNPYSGWFLDIYGVALYLFPGEIGKFESHEFQLDDSYQFGGWPKTIKVNFS